MPHAIFEEEVTVEFEDSAGGVLVSNEKSSPMTLRISRMERSNCEVYRLENGNRIRVETSGPGITFSVRPGNYEILCK